MELVGRVQRGRKGKMIKNIENCAGQWSAVRVRGLEDTEDRESVAGSVDWPFQR